jgi:hypothetical protein
MEYIKAFLIGGSIIAGAKLVSANTTPMYGAIIGGMPTGIITSLFLTNRNAMSQFYTAYAYHAIILACTIVFIHHTIDNYDYNPYLVCIIGMIVWAILSLGTSIYLSKW